MDIEVYTIIESYQSMQDCAPEFKLMTPQLEKSI